jgi:hypothetical protein
MRGHLCRSLLPSSSCYGHDLLPQLPYTKSLALSTSANQCGTVIVSPRVIIMYLRTAESAHRIASHWEGFSESFTDVGQISVPHINTSFKMIVVVARSCRSGYRDSHLHRSCSIGNRRRVLSVVGHRKHYLLRDIVVCIASPSPIGVTPPLCSMGHTVQNCRQKHFQIPEQKLPSPAHTCAGIHCRVTHAASKNFLDCIPEHSSIPWRQTRPEQVLSQGNTARTRTQRRQAPPCR